MERIHSFTDAESMFKTRKRKLAGNTYLEGNPDRGWYGIRFHSTLIVVFHSDGRITLNTGGWKTATTKKRINDALVGVSLYQEKFVWYLQSLPYGESAPIEFFDLIVIYPDGHIGPDNLGLGGIS